jgi:hypothetical protein
MEGGSRKVGDSKGIPQDRELRSVQESHTSLLVILHKPYFESLNVKSAGIDKQASTLLDF